MKTLITLLLSITIVMPASSQSQTVDVGSFSELSLGIPATVYLKQGSSSSVEVRCDEDIFDEIEFEMKGDRLVISREGSWSWGSSWRKSEVDIYITMNTIEALSVSGSGLLQSDGVLKTDELKLSVSGSGDMELKLNADELDMRISGSGSINLEGDAIEAEAGISG